MTTHPFPASVDNTYTTFPGLCLLQTLGRNIPGKSDLKSDRQKVSKTDSKLAV